MTATIPAPCDDATASSVNEGDVAHPTWTLVATILASSLAFVDGSVVNVALPAIEKSLGAGAADLQWTVNAYLLPLSALLLIGGAAGDHFGRRRLLLGGIGLFTVASVCCALAPTLAFLLLGRALQGIGAAMLMPNSLAILGAAFSGEARGRAIGTWASVGAIASAVGPPLGGWLVEAIGWRAIFLLNLPLAAAALFVAWRYVEESQEGELPLDWKGAACATVALGALTWSLTLWSSERAMTVASWAGLLIGLAALSVFLLIEKRLGEQAMMPLTLFGSGSFVGLTLLTFLLYGTLGGLLVLLPYLLIEGGGYTPLQAGMALLPFPILIGAASPMMGRIAGRLGPKWPLTLGPMITSVGLALLTRIDADAAYWTTVFPAILVIALGLAGAVAPLTTAVLSAVDRRHTGTASGFNSAIARTGGLIATALAGAVIVQVGAPLVAAFHHAAWIGAVLAFLAGAAAAASLRGNSPEPQA